MQLIRPIRADDTAAPKRVVAGSGLFPPDLLDGMLDGYLAGEEQDDLWLTVDDGSGPLAIAYCTPERMTEGTWKLLLIAVDPDRRSGGIGAALLEHIEAALRARGERVPLVETSGVPQFERTRSFYRDNGYDEEARIRDYYDAGDDKGRLRLSGAFADRGVGFTSRARGPAVPAGNAWRSSRRLP